MLVDSCWAPQPRQKLSDAQFGCLAQELSRHRHTPTLMMAHHPVTRESAVTNAAGPTFVLNTADANRLQELMADVPGILMMHAGHTATMWFAAKCFKYEKLPQLDSNQQPFD